MADGKLAARNPRLEGLRVLVVGLGRSGVAAARLASAKGARVLAADCRSEVEIAASASPLREAGIEVRGGGHPPEMAEACDLIVVSPGVPTGVQLLEAARSRQVPVWAEIELARRFCLGRILAVTGSNGKSTTTSMAGGILRGAGIPGGTGGNLGTPLADLLVEDSPDAVHAVEVSSFQLETVESFRAEVAVVVNLSPDHLDRHGGLVEYAAAKARLLELQTPSDAAILNEDDVESRRLLSAVRGRLYRFSTRVEVDPGAFVRDGALVLRTEHGEETLLEVSDLPVPGEHNVSNALAAALACRLSGAGASAISQGLRRYRALPHRLQLVAEVDGVAFFDDSKATNLDATTRALRSFPGKRVHLILGGRDKGADWSSLAPALRRHACRVLLVGEASDAIETGLGRILPLERCETIPRAVRVAYDEAAPGDVVLLAPGCASFDQYHDFQERGRDFQRAVSALLPEEGHHA